MVKRKSRNKLGRRVERKEGRVTGQGTTMNKHPESRENIYKATSLRVKGMARYKTEQIIK